MVPKVRLKVDDWGQVQTFNLAGPDALVFALKQAARWESEGAGVEVQAWQQGSRTWRTVYRRPAAANRRVPCRC